MIESISIEAGFSADYERGSLEHRVLEVYPYPLARCYHNLQAVDDPLAWLGVFAKDMTSTLLQYLSLVTLHDYALSEMPRSYRVFTALEAMVYRPGPGKWLGFMRECALLYRAERAVPREPALLKFIEAHGISGKKYREPKVTYTDAATTTRAPALEFLVTLRNRWAHSKHLLPEQAEALRQPLSELMLALYADLEFLCGHPLLLVGPEGTDYQLEGWKLPDLSQLKGANLELVLAGPGDRRPFLSLAHQAWVGSGADLLLLEELIQDKQAIYTSSYNSRKVTRKDEEGRNLLEGVLETVARVQAEGEILTLQRASFEQFHNRCVTSVEGVINDFVDSGKYSPEFYVEPEGVRDTLQGFLSGKEGLLLLSGEQGRGKSALACHWAKALTGPTGEIPEGPGGQESSASPGNRAWSGRVAVVFIEAHRLMAYANPERRLIERAVQAQLQLDPDVELDRLLDKVAEDMGEEDRILFVLDAVNEFESQFGPGGEYSRADLLEATIAFCRVVCSSETLAGRAKVMASLRWDSFRHVSFGPEAFTEQYGRRLRGMVYQPAGLDRVDVEVPALDEVATARLYEQVRSARIGMSPSFEFDVIRRQLRKDLCNPLLLQVFMNAHDGAPEPLVHSVDGLSKRFVQELFLESKEDAPEIAARKRKHRTFMSALLQAMDKKATAHIVLDPEDGDLSDLMEEVTTRSRLSSDGVADTSALEDLSVAGIVREDLVRTSQAGHKGTGVRKRISLAHEMVAGVLNEQKRLLSRSGSRRFYTKLVAWFSLGAAGMTLLATISYLVGFGEWEKSVLFLKFMAPTFVLMLAILVFGAGIFSVLHFAFEGIEASKDRILNRLLGREELLEVFRRKRFAENLQAFYGVVGWSIAAFLLMFVVVQVAEHLAYGVGGYNASDESLRGFVSASAVLVGILMIAMATAGAQEAAAFGDVAQLHSMSKGRRFLGEAIAGVFGVAVLIGVLLALPAFIDLVSSQIADNGPSWLNTTYRLRNSFRNTYEHLLEDAPFLQPRIALIWPWFLLLFMLAIRRSVGHLLVRVARRRRRELEALPCESKEKSISGYRLAAHRRLRMTSIAVCAALPVLASLLLPDLRLDFGDITLKAAGLGKKEGDQIRSIEVRVDEGSRLAGKITSVAGLRGIEHLRELKLHNADVTDLTPLQDLPLTSVRLSRLPPAAATTLGSLTRVSKLVLRDMAVSDLRRLKGMDSLRSLTLERIDADTWSIDWLSPSVRYLYLWECEVQSLAFLSAGLRLEDLDIYNLGTHPGLTLSLAPFQLDSLRQLRLQDIPVDILPETQLPGLQGLYLGRTGTDDLSFVRHSPHLERVQLYNLPVRDLSPLKECPELMQLKVIGCPVEDVSEFQDKPGLSFLFRPR